MKNVLAIPLLLFITAGVSDTVSVDTTATDSLLLQPSPNYRIPQSFFKGFFDDPFPGFPPGFDSSFNYSFSGSISNNLSIDIQDKKGIVTAYIPGSDNSKIDVLL